MSNTDVDVTSWALGNLTITPAAHSDADFGFHALSWSRVCKDVKVFGFEPDPSTYAILKRNCAKNQINQDIQIFELAVSDRNGTSTFYRCADSGYSSLKNTERSTVVKNFEVKTISIDHFVDLYNLSKVDLIKIDIEGLEHSAIQGGLKTLRTYSPDLLVELSTSATAIEDPQKTFALLQSLGYRAKAFSTQGLVDAEQYSETFHNYAFSKKY